MWRSIFISLSIFNPTRQRLQEDFVVNLPRTSTIARRR
jgi:hypothetical protein